MRLISGAIVALALASGAASLSGQSAPVAPLRFVSTPWPPFTNEVGKPRIALSLVETALGRAGLKADTTIVEPAQFTAAQKVPSSLAVAAPCDNKAMTRSLVRRSGASCSTALFFTTPV